MFLETQYSLTFLPTYLVKSQLLGDAKTNKTYVYKWEKMPNVFNSFNLWYQ